MIKDDVIYLINEAPSDRGLFDASALSERRVFCRVDSVTSADFWRAQTAGVELAVVFVLSDYIDYHGEKLIRWRDKYFDVIRTYAKGYELEISCEENKRYVNSPQIGA